MEIIKNIKIEGVHTKPIVTDVFYKENHQSKKVIIFCHGYKGFKDWGAWNLMAEAFANSGFFFIKFNFSHNGGTPEQPIDFPDLEAFGNNNYSKELDDLGSVIDWISKNSTYANEIDLMINDNRILGEHIKMFTELCDEFKHNNIESQLFILNNIELMALRLEYYQLTMKNVIEETVTNIYGLDQTPSISASVQASSC